MGLRDGVDGTREACGWHVIGATGHHFRLNTDAAKWARRSPVGLSAVLILVDDG